jgi:molecular chaperone DnaK (HSP70)
MLDMSKEDVDEIVLVGGSTRIPHIKKLLKDYFGKERLNDDIDPDITVAYGAASILD